MITATEIFCLNEQGKRSNNQDCISPKKGTATLNDKLFIVCDGVGGENKGEVASQIVCASIQMYLNDKKHNYENDKKAIKDAISFAKSELANYANNDYSAIRMSTTLSMVFLGSSMINIAWCGDTRVHHIRKGRVLWKSKDHSLVGELVRSGEISELEARNHPRRNIITRSLNASNTNDQVDFYELTEYKDGDYLLLCTDGFLEQIDEERIEVILEDTNERDKEKQFLYYCEGKTRDNFSMYLIKIGLCYEKKRQLKKRQLVIIFVLMVFCITCILLVISKLNTGTFYK